MQTTTEIAVVGAGPAGMAAALAAADAGAKVVVVDEGARPGGQFFRQPDLPANGGVPKSLRQNFQRGAKLAGALLHPNIRLLPQTTVWNLTPRRQLYLHASGGRQVLQANRVILAAGATERAAAFPGWTLPGIMTIGAAQTLLKSHGLVPGGRVVLAGTGPLLLVAARQLAEAGARVTEVLEATRFLRWLQYAPRWLAFRDRLLEGLDHLRWLSRAGVIFRFGQAVARAEGDGQVQRVEASRLDSHWRPMRGTARWLQADTVCLNYGFIPATELARLAGCVHAFDPALGALATVTDENMETTVGGLYAAGEVRGIGGAEAALVEGRLAGLAAARSLGFKIDEREAARARERQAYHRAFAALLSEMFAARRGLADLAEDDTPVCRCEEVTAGEVRRAARAGALTLNALKAWNRAGMGYCQGRTCAPIAAQILASAADVAPEAAGTFTARLPAKPVPLGVVGVTEGPRATGTAMEDHVGYGQARVR